MAVRRVPVNQLRFTFDELLEDDPQPVPPSEPELRGGHESIPEAAPGSFMAIFSEVPGGSLAAWHAMPRDVLRDLQFQIRRDMAALRDWPDPFIEARIAEYRAQARRLSEVRD